MLPRPLFCTQASAEKLSYKNHAGFSGLLLSMRYVPAIVLLFSVSIIASLSLPGPRHEYPGVNHHKSSKLRLSSQWSARKPSPVPFIYPPIVYLLSPIWLIWRDCPCDLTRPRNLLLPIYSTHLQRPGMVGICRFHFFIKGLEPS